MKKYLLNALKIGVILLTGYYLYTAIQRDVSQLKLSIFKTSHLKFLLLAFLAFGIFFLLKTFNWYKIVTLSGGRLSFSASSKIWYGSQTIKYLPGKVWFIVARFYFARGHVTAPLIFMSTLVELILMLLSATLIFFVLGGYHFLRLIENQWIAVGIPVLMIPLAFSLIHPFFLNKILSLFKRFSRSPLEPLTMKYREIFNLLMIYSLNWILFGLANVLILYALSSKWPALSFRTAGIFPISYVIGFLSFLTPGGIGVRESIQVYLLGEVGCGSAIAVAVAIISRIFWMAWEVIGAIIFVGVKNTGIKQLLHSEEDKTADSRSSFD